MVAIAITPAEVTAAANAPTTTGIAQVAITAGQAVFLDATNNGKVNVATNLSRAGAEVVGIAVNNAAAGQPVTYIKAGGRFSVTTGATFTVGIPYFLDAGGAIAPLADLASLDYVTFLGIAVSATAFYFDPVVSGVQKP